MNCGTNIKPPLPALFSYDAVGNVILLEAFIKNHKRKTDAALASAHFLLEVDITDYFKTIA